MLFGRFCDFRLEHPFVASAETYSAALGGLLGGSVPFLASILTSPMSDTITTAIPILSLVIKSPWPS